MVGVFFIIGLLVSSPAIGVEPVPGAQPEAVDAPMGRVRSANARIRGALQRGSRDSERFRRLLETLEASDVIVYVEDGRCQVLQPSGCIQLASAAQGVRYLRISVNPWRGMLQLVPLLAHELQHAVEIAQAPDVVDTATMQSHYRRIGQLRTEGVYETREAIDVAVEVWHQLKVGR